MNEPIPVLITLPFSDELVSRLRGISPRLQIQVTRARKPEDVSDEVWKRLQVLYTDQVLPAIEQAPQLNWIQFHTAGVDHAVEAPILKKEGLVATTMSGASASQMGEFVLMMLLALGHQMADLFRMKAKGEWQKDRWEQFQPLELRHATVGIVGYGSIGRQVARLLQPFGSQVLATKRNVMDPEHHGYSPEGLGDPYGEMVHRLYPPQALRSMVKVSDFVVVTVPKTETTRDLINEEILDAFKPGAYLVDVSRGGVVNQADLIAALREKRIAGAALDVFTQEPLPAESPLWKMENVILSPHIAGFSPYYNRRAVELFAENLSRYLGGLRLFNRIDPDRGY